MILKNNSTWFPHFYSKRKVDYVYSNNLATCRNLDGCYHGESKGHLDIYFNTPYHPKVNGLRTSKIGLGCSMTFGTGVEKHKTWPALLGYKNLGMPGIGVDGIYYNLVRLIEDFRPHKVIICFPNMERKLLIFKKKNFYFRIPVSVSDDMPNYDRDFFCISRSEIKELIMKTKEQIQKENIIEYSSHFLKKISKLDVDLTVGTWCEYTMPHLSHFFKNPLPLFYKHDLSNDRQHHGVESHKNWAEIIKNHKI